jgi:hypothetical protein
VSPDATTSAAVLARLAVEITEDRAGIAKRLEDAREAARRIAVTPADPGALALAGVALHGWYTRLETIFERVARGLDQSLPTGDRWHRELLSQMSAEVPGVRPRVIDPALVPDLALLLAFRHFFRHAYAVTFDAQHLRVELDRLLSLAAVIDGALDALATFLGATMTSLAQE